MNCIYINFITNLIKIFISFQIDQINTIQFLNHAKIERLQL